MSLMRVQKDSAGNILMGMGQEFRSSLTVLCLMLAGLLAALVLSLQHELGSLMAPMFALGFCMTALSAVALWRQGRKLEWNLQERALYVIGRQQSDMYYIPFAEVAALRITRRFVAQRTLFSFNRQSGRPDEMENKRKNANMRARYSLELLMRDTGYEGIDHSFNKKEIQDLAVFLADACGFELFERDADEAFRNDGDSLYESVNVQKHRASQFAPSEEEIRAAQAKSAAERGEVGAQNANGSANANINADAAMGAGGISPEQQARVNDILAESAQGGSGQKNFEQADSNLLQSVDSAAEEAAKRAEVEHFTAYTNGGNSTISADTEPPLGELDYAEEVPNTPPPSSALLPHKDGGIEWSLSPGWASLALTGILASGMVASAGVAYSQMGEDNVMMIMTFVMLGFAAMLFLRIARALMSNGHLYIHNDVLYRELHQAGSKIKFVSMKEIQAIDPKEEMTPEELREALAESYARRDSKNGVELPLQDIRSVRVIAPRVGRCQLQAVNRQGKAFVIANVSAGMTPISVGDLYWLRGFLKRQVRETQAEGQKE